MKLFDELNADIEAYEDFLCFRQKKNIRLCCCFSYEWQRMKGFHIQIKILKYIYFYAIANLKKNSV